MIDVETSEQWLARVELFVRRFVLTVFFAGFTLGVLVGGSIVLLVAHAKSLF